MKVIKQCVGIDVSKDSLDCCMGSLNDDQQETFSKTKKFLNNEAGFHQLLKWVNSERRSSVVFVMEATGVYYENLAYWLHDHDEKLSVLLPNKVKHYAKSLNIKTKTDSKDARVLSQLGLERRVEHWQVPSKIGV